MRSDDFKHIGLIVATIRRQTDIAITNRYQWIQARLPLREKGFFYSLNV